MKVKKAHKALLADSTFNYIIDKAKELTIHPKLLRLLLILKQNNDKAIVFTQYRDTAKHIVDILNKEGINAIRFVGQADKIDDKGLKQDEQIDIINKFKIIIEYW